MSKQALISLLSDRNQRIEELQTQSNYFEGEFCTQKRITTELQAQVEQLEIARNCLIYDKDKLQAQVDELEFKLTSYTIVKRMIKAEKQVEELQAQVDMLQAALQKAGQLAEDERWDERFPRVFGSMQAAIQGEGDET